MARGEPCGTGAWPPRHRATPTIGSRWWHRWNQWLDRGNTNGPSREYRSSTRQDLHQLVFKRDGPLLAICAIAYIDPDSRSLRHSVPRLDGLISLMLSILCFGEDTIPKTTLRGFSSLVANPTP